jgi:hypothetical protein
VVPHSRPPAPQPEQKPPGRVKELLRDGVARMTAFLVVLACAFSACGRLTGVMFDLSAEQLRNI